MKLFLLKHSLQGYDIHRAFMIRAYSEAVARKMASERAGDEGPAIWETCSCVVITACGDTEVIITDFRAG